MARSSAFFLLLSSLFQQSLASPVHLRPGDRIFSSASTLVVPLATGKLPTVTFYPSQGITIPPSSSSVIPPFPSTRNGVTVSPARSPFVPLATGAIPFGSIPLGPAVSSGTTLPKIGVTSPSVSPETGVNLSSVILPNGISASTILPPIDVTSSSVPLGAGARLSSTPPPTVSTAKSSTGIVCATGCAACATPVLKRDNSPHQQELPEKRSLANPDDYDSVDQYVMEQGEFSPVLFYQFAILVLHLLNVQKTVRKLKIS